MMTMMASSLSMEAARKDAMPRPIKPPMIS